MTVQDMTMYYALKDKLYQKAETVIKEYLKNRIDFYDSSEVRNVYKSGKNEVTIEYVVMNEYDLIYVNDRLTLSFEEFCTGELKDARLWH